MEMENQILMNSIIKSMKRTKNGDFKSSSTSKLIISEIRTHIAILNSTCSSTVANRELIYSSIRILSNLAEKKDNVSLIVECGGVPALVRYLQAPLCNEVVALEHQVETISAFTLGLLTIDPEYKQVIVDAGAIPHLVELLKRRHKDGRKSQELNAVIINAAGTLSKLADKNTHIKTGVMVEGGIPLLVELLTFTTDAMVQIASQKALRILVFFHDDIKTQIVECNALAILVQLLRSEVHAITFETVFVIVNLISLSPHMTDEVLLVGALQPVIELLSSRCPKTQGVAASLLGQFAGEIKDCKAHIVQRGAVGPLIENLQSPDDRVKSSSAFALGMLALKDSHNPAGIARSSAIPPLLKLLDSGNDSVIDNVTSVLYGLAENEDSVVDLIKMGGVQRLQDGVFIFKKTRDRVASIFKNLEDKFHGPVLSRLLHLMRIAEKSVQTRVALTLAHFCLLDDLKTIFIDSNGLDILLEHLESSYVKDRRDSCVALCKLAEKATSLSPVDAQKPSPIQVNLGEQYVNNRRLSDVTFLIEGKRFYAHRVCLVASSDAFRAMFDGGYKEKDAKDIIIPNIRWNVFESMMRYIYTGSIDVNLEIAQDLLKAPDQYLLEGLKRLCECTIAQDIKIDNVSLMYDLSEDFNAVSLKNSCILFVLNNFEKSNDNAGFAYLFKRILPEIRSYFVKALARPVEKPFED